MLEATLRLLTRLRTFATASKAERSEDAATRNGPRKKRVHASVTEELPGERKHFGCEKQDRLPAEQSKASQARRAVPNAD